MNHVQMDTCSRNLTPADAAEFTRLHLEAEEAIKAGWARRKAAWAYYQERRLVRAKARRASGGGA